MKKVALNLAVLLVATAAFALAGWPTPVDPNGPNSGASRVLAGGWPTPADPNGPNSGASRTLVAFPTVVDPNGPNSGVGRTAA